MYGIGPNSLCSGARSTLVPICGRYLLAAEEFESKRSTQENVGQMTGVTSQLTAGSLYGLCSVLIALRVLSQEPEMNSAALNAAKLQLRSLMKQRLANLSQESILSQSELLSYNRVLYIYRYIVNHPPRRKGLRLVMQIQTVR